MPPFFRRTKAGRLVTSLESIARFFAGLVEEENHPSNTLRNEW
jgi:hypothetical protein